MFLKALFFWFIDNVLLSLNRLFLVKKNFSSSDTAADTNGPAKGPLPTSSIPTIFLFPHFNNFLSISPWGNVVLDKGIGVFSSSVKLIIFSQIELCWNFFFYFVSFNYSSTYNFISLIENNGLSRRYCSLRFVKSYFCVSL